MYIYKIINNLNGKAYIGLKSKTVEESENYYGSGTLINQAIDKYGKDNFTKEILERDIDSHEHLNTQEIYWINSHDTYNNGYNLTKGGQGNLGRAVSEETKSKIKTKLTGGKLSEERKKKISDAAKLRKSRPTSKEAKERLRKAATGRKMSAETKLKMSISARNRKQNN